MKVVIIGGVATGPKVAARLRRLIPDAEITIIEQGNMISYGSCGLPMYLGNLVPRIEDLMKTSAGLIRDTDFFREQRDIKVLTAAKATGIDRNHQEVRVCHLPEGTERSLPYDYLVLATGGKPYIPDLPGMGLNNVFCIHHPEEAEKFKRLLNEQGFRHISIIGAGLIGLEIADALAGKRLKVTVVEIKDQILPKILDADIAGMVAGQMRRRRMDLRLGCQVEALEGLGSDKVTRVVSKQGSWDTDAVIMATGVIPEVELARNAGLVIRNKGGILVDNQLRTNDPYIFAGGDCVEQHHILNGCSVYLPLASTANKQGRVIADNIAGRSSSFPGVAGAAVLQAFDLNIGRTGLSEEEAQKGYQVISGIYSGLDSVHYYPMHAGITLKLIAEATSGRILGAQVCGQGEAIKRLDVLTTAMNYGATLKDVSNLDLGYAPAYATAIDVVIHAANALENKRLGLVKSMSPQQFFARVKEGENICMVDVREREEMLATPLRSGNVLQIPLGELRRRWQEVTAQTEVVTFCELGIRAYEAACFLKGKGLNSAYLEGGMSVWASYQN